MSNLFYQCSRCSGKGYIQIYSHVVAGVCFSCKGTGKQKSKPQAKTKWAVFGEHKSSPGSFLRLYNVAAKDSKSAIALAKKTMSKGSQFFNESYTLDNAVAIKWSDMKNKSATNLHEVQN